jgi:hypothetical protein
MVADLIEEQKLVHAETRRRGDALFLRVSASPRDYSQLYRIAP